MKRSVALIYPRGTCKAQEFYFRGGDGLSEPENLLTEYKASVESYKRSNQALKEVRNEYNRFSTELDDVDQCIMRIAVNMGHDSSETAENKELRLRIQKLNMEIDDVENKIAEINQKCSPSEFMSMVDEHAQFKPLLKDLTESLDVDYSTKMKREIGEIILSQEFSESVESLVEKHVALDVKAQLRSNLSTILNRINQQKSSNVGKICEIDDKDLMGKIEILKDVSLDSLESQIQLDLTRSHQKIFLKMEIDRLEEMNEFLALMSMETINTTEILRKCEEDHEDVQ